MTHRPHPWLMTLGFCLALPLTLLAPASQAAAEPPDFHSEAAARHVLDRLGFGPRPGDLAAVEAIGADVWIDQQLAPADIPLPASLTAQLQALTTQSLSPAALFQLYGPPIRQAGASPDPDAVKAARIRAKIILTEAIDARFLQAIESPRQLQEVMVDFWFNHFNVYAQKGLDHLWIGAYEAQAIRPYVLGHFRDLLAATARHPAMLFYLDNWQNVAPGSPAGPGQTAGLNENYAREIMELHTLGVNGGYSQDDVIALARIFTGWGFNRNALRRGDEDPGETGFRFNRNRHDFGEKAFLGHQIPGSGEAEGEAAMDLLAQDPHTAQHLSLQLAQYFVADNPDPALVEKLAARYLATKGDISAVLRRLFHSPEFWAPATRGSKYKTPYQYVISSLRATGLPVTDAKPLYAATQRMGMPLYGYQTPDGYKNTRDAWLSPDDTAKRLGFATALAAGRLPLTPPAADHADIPDAQRPDAQALLVTLGHRFSANTLAVIDRSPPALQAALVLGSPDFMTK